MQRVELKPRKSSESAFCQMLKAACKVKDGFTDDNVVDLLYELQTACKLVVPAESPDKVYCIYDRIPVLAGLPNHKSAVMKILLDRPEDLGLMVDVNLSGRDGLFFVGLAHDTVLLNGVVECMSKPEMVVRNYCAGASWAAPVSAFVREE